MEKINNKEKARFKAIFFDFGGTLMDAESDNKAHLEMMKDIISRYDLTLQAEVLVAKYNSLLFTKEMTLLDPDPLNKSFSPLWESTKKAFTHLLSESRIIPTEEDFSWWKEIYLKRHLELIRLFPETFPLIGWIRKNTSLHLGIISDIDNEYLEFQFRSLGIRDLFDSITTSEEVQTYKPDPQIFQTALNKAGCSGKEAMIIGDSYTKDILGGKKMEMTTIWINKFLIEKNSNCKEQADFIVGHLREVLPILEQLLK